MSRGMTPSILALLNQRASDKLRCVIRLHYCPNSMADSATESATSAKTGRKSLPPLS